jgi:hypothetical protein
LETIVQPTDPRRLERALFWRAVERELRGRGWSKSRAAAYVAALRRGGAAETLHNEMLGPKPKPAGLLARLWGRIRG